MVDNLMKTFENFIGNASWMDEESRQGGVAKLKKMLSLVGYPQFLVSSEDLDKYYETVDTFLE